MREPLSAKQKIVLATIVDLTHQTGGAPTLEKVRKALGYTSISSVQRHTDALKRKGYLKQSRGLSLVHFAEKAQIPLVGNIAAGTPLLAIENVEAYIPYEVSKLRGPAEDYFFLRAVGDSMNHTDISGKTIDNGDFVLVKRQTDAESGDRIVALIGEEATIKRLYISSEYIELKPESDNPQNKPIYVFENILVQGKVCDVVKRGDEDG
jgi:repressor LexA